MSSLAIHQINQIRDEPGKHAFSELVRACADGACRIARLCNFVVFLRISGERTLSKLNAFDLVVTIALGSTLSAIIL